MNRLCQLLPRDVFLLLGQSYLNDRDVLCRLGCTSQHIFNILKCSYHIKCSPQIYWLFHTSEKVEVRNVVPVGENAVRNEFCVATINIEKNKDDGKDKPSMIPGINSISSSSRYRIGQQQHISLQLWQLLDANREQLRQIYDLTSFSEFLPSSLRSLFISSPRIRWNTNSNLSVMMLHFRHLTELKIENCRRDFFQLTTESHADLVWPPLLTKLHLNCHPEFEEAHRYCITDKNNKNDSESLPPLTEEQDIDHAKQSQIDEKQDLVLPETLTQLFISTYLFPDRYHTNPELLHLPQTLSRLHIEGPMLGDIKKWRFPLSLTELRLSREFNNASIDGWILPARLEKLTFGNLFDQDLSRIRWRESKALTTLIIGDALYEGNAFNLSLDSVILPDTLTHLNLGYSFDRSLINFRFPPRLEVLEFESEWNRDLNVELRNLPPTLHTLKFGVVMEQSMQLLHWPSLPSLTHLEWGRGVDGDTLAGVTPPPARLKVLHLPGWAQHLRPEEFLNHLHEGLEELRLSSTWEATVDAIAALKFPASLKTLIMPSFFDAPLDQLAFPDGLTELRFGGSFTHSLNHFKWPSALRVLQLAWYQIRSPSDETYLSGAGLGPWNADDLDQLILPDSLEVWKLGDEFDRDLTEFKFPPLLKELYISIYYPHSLLDLKYRPANMRVFRFGQEVGMQQEEGEVVAEGADEAIEDGEGVEGVAGGVENVSDVEDVNEEVV